MSGGPRSRFSRPIDPAPAERVTIEREKIRHRRPDDMRVQDPLDEPLLVDEQQDVDLAVDEPDDRLSSSWDDDGDDWPEQSGSADDDGWDDSSSADDEWVFEEGSPEGPALNDPPADDGGIAWEDADDIEIGGANEHPDYTDERKFAPEVELAGRRDVRPKPPKRPRPPQAGRPGEASRQAQAKRPPSMENAGPVSQPRAPIEEDEVDFAIESPAMRQAGPASSQAKPRFARTQATLEIDTDRPRTSGRQPPFQISQQGSSRRRQPQPMVPPAVATKPRSRKYLTMLLVVALIGVGGWFAFRTIGERDVTGLIDGLSATLGGRTGAETPFGGASTPEEALRDLTRESQGQTPDLLTPGSGDGGYQVGDPSTSEAGDPPLPYFKPRTEATGQAAPSGSTLRVEQLDGEETGGSGVEAEDADGPSVMQKIWGNLIAN